MHDTYFRKKALWLNHLFAITVFGVTFLLSFFAAHNDWTISTYLSLLDGLLAAVLGALVALQLADIARADAEIRDPSPEILRIYRSMRNLASKPRRVFARDECEARLRELAEVVSQGDARGDVIFDLEQLDGRMRTLHNEVVKEALRDDHPEPLRLVHFLAENDAYFSNVLWQQIQRNVDHDLRIGSYQSSSARAAVAKAASGSGAAKSEPQFRTTLQRILIYDEGRYRDVHELMRDAPSRAFIAWHMEHPYECRLMSNSQYDAIRQMHGEQDMEPPAHDFGLYGDWVETGNNARGNRALPGAAYSTTYTRDPAAADRLRRLFGECWKRDNGQPPPDEFRRHVGPIGELFPLLQPESTAKIYDSSAIYSQAADIVGRSEKRLKTSNIRIRPQALAPPDFANARDNYVHTLAAHLLAHPDLDYDRVLYIGPGDVEQTWEFRQLEHELGSLLPNASPKMQIWRFPSNPMNVDVLITDDEAVISFPTTETGELRFAIVIRNDPDAIKVLADWYQTFLLSDPDKSELSTAQGLVPKASP